MKRVNWISHCDDAKAKDLIAANAIVGFSYKSTCEDLSRIGYVITEVQYDAYCEVVNDQIDLDLQQLLTSSQKQS